MKKKFNFFENSLENFEKKNSLCKLECSNSLWSIKIIAIFFFQTTLTSFLRSPSIERYIQLSSVL